MEQRYWVNLFCWNLLLCVILVAVVVAVYVWSDPMMPIEQSMR